ncbi:hypothetical protein ACIG3E_23425 [Streptomyces sp. NPDC053474]|uniref:hypothetical protein n=1 Tax=Streptomyces sp. NPDC053474 TaxID=3365704 RepID=UPI0037D9903C
MRAGGWGRYENARRCLTWGLLLVVTAGITMLLLAGRSAADPGPTPAPSPSPSIPKYEPGLEPTAPGLLPPESVNPTTPPPAKDKNDTRDGGKNRSHKDKNAKKQTAKQKKAAKQKKMRRALEKAVSAYKKKHGDGGVLSAFEVTDKNGVPISAYRISSDDGGITDVIGKLQAAATQGMFEVTKWLVAIGCWLISWALSWSLAAVLLKPALRVSDSLYTGAVVQLGVPGLLLAFSGTVAVWHIFFGNRSRGWGEIAASTLISALAVSALAAPPQLLLSSQDGAVGKARDLGIAVFAIVRGNEDALPKTGQISHDTAKELTRPITDEIVEAFVVRPAILLSYNQSLDDKCTDLYRKSRIQQALFNDKVDGVKKAVKKAPSRFNLVPVPNFVTDITDAITDKAVDFVTNDVLGLNPGENFEKACIKDAGSAKRVSWGKAGGACFVTLAALLVFLLLAVTAFGYLVTQLRLVIEAILARVALAAGIMPGPGRAWLWERAVTILRLLGLLVALVVALAITITLVTTLLDDGVEIPGGLTVRFVVVDVVTIAAFCYRKRIAARSRTWAAQTRSRLGSSRFGGRAPTQMDPQVRHKRSVAASLATTALLAAATGGAAAGGSRMLALGGRSSGTLATRLGARAAARGTGAALRGGGRLIQTGGKAAVGAGKASAKYTVGAPVYLPQAARATAAALKAAPGNTARSAAQLRQRLTRPVIQRLPQARHFGQTYWNNIGGRWTRNRIRMHRGLPPIPRPTAPPPASNRPVRPAPARRPAPAPTPTPAPAPAQAARPPRRAPVRMPQPANSARQAALQQQLYRRRLQQTPANPPRQQPTPPSPAPRRPASQRLPHRPRTPGQGGQP